MKRRVSDLTQSVEQSRDVLIETTQRLVRIRSETPPGDTTTVAPEIAKLVSQKAEISLHTSQAPIENLVAVVKGNGPGKRLIFNGHLDTYPAGEFKDWTHDPFSGEVVGNRLYGRGAADMKGGIACALLAFNLLAENTHLWSGELVLVLVGDEESMGTLGSRFLLDTVPEARGDAMLCGDVGSPRVPRIGEKGMIWLDVFATGKPAHGAHVHRGVNAIDAMRTAMDALAKLSDYVVKTPEAVAVVINQAKPISEPLGGVGEADVLQKVTVNFGRLIGGTTANLVADSAELNVDIRLPFGVTVAEVEAEIEHRLKRLPGIRFEIIRRYESSWTSPEDPIVTAVLAASTDVLPQDEYPIVNMRVGASDARLYRAAGIPTVVSGLTPHNLGGPDEYVDIDELIIVAKIHILSALNFLAVA